MTYSGEKLTVLTLGLNDIWPGQIRIRGSITDTTITKAGIITYRSDRTYPIVNSPLPTFGDFDFTVDQMALSSIVLFADSPTVSPPPPPSVHVNFDKNLNPSAFSDYDTHSARATILTGKDIHYNLTIDSFSYNGTDYITLLFIKNSNKVQENSIVNWKISPESLSIAQGFDTIEVNIPMYATSSISGNIKGYVTN